MRFEFHPEALAEFEAAARFYSQRQDGLDLRFIEAVEATISRIVKEPSIFRVIENDIRRCLTRVFPYAVLFSIEADFVLIIAVMHCHREPGYWRHRLATGD